MRNIIRLLFVTSLFFVSIPNEAIAETTLFLSPMRVEVSREKPVMEIRVTNMSSIARAYQLSVENYIMNANGQTARVDNFDYSAKRMVRFVPRHFDIAPGGKQIVRVMARLPEGMEDGQFHAHLEFLENVQRRLELNKDASEEQRARMMAQIAYATAIPIIVSNGETNTDVGMKNLSIGQDKKGNPTVNLTLTRSGNGQGNIFLEADYVTSDGSIKKAAVRRTIHVYRELNERPHEFSLELLEPADIKKGGKVEVKLYNKDVSETEPQETMLIPVS